MVDDYDDFLERSATLEAVLVAYVHDLTVIVANVSPEVNGDRAKARAAEDLAAHARGEIQRCLQARTLYRRIRHRPQAEIVLALCQADLCDHAAALVTGDWGAHSLAMVP
jgi:hypothetical protein